MATVWQVEPTSGEEEAALHTVTEAVEEADGDALCDAGRKHAEIRRIRTAAEGQPAAIAQHECWPLRCDRKQLPTTSRGSLRRVLHAHVGDPSCMVGHDGHGEAVGDILRGSAAEEAERSGVRQHPAPLVTHADREAQSLCHGDAVCKSDRLAAIEPGSILGKE